MLKKLTYGKSFALIFLIVYFLFFISKIKLFAGLSILLTCIAPFYYLIMWFSLSETGKQLRATTQGKWHLGICVSIATFIYFIFSRQWGAGLLNQLFSVDASAFPITSSLLNLLYIPYNVVFNSQVASIIQKGSLLFAMLGAIFNALSLIISTGWKKPLKFFLYLLLFSITVNFVTTIFYRISLIKDDIIVEFALWADFNATDYCTDDWARLKHSTLFLNGDRVLVYYPQSISGKQWYVRRCSFQP